MTEKALTEHMKFLSDVAILYEAFSPVLECLLLRNFFVKKVSGVLEFLLDD